MADKLSKSNQQLDKDNIAEMLSYREDSLKIFFSNHNPEFAYYFTGLSQEEVEAELKYHLSEIEKDACLNLLASIEAIFRLDYAIRCEEKDKAIVPETMNRIILEHDVYTCVKVDGALPVASVEPVAELQAVALPKFALDEVVNLYEVLPMLSYNADDTMTII